MSHNRTRKYTVGASLGFRVPLKDLEIYVKETRADDNVRLLPTVSNNGRIPNIIVAKRKGNYH